ncbi:glutathione S-transferase [Lipomyces kononenkoae]|uniref:Glutathione S-transferase n=1 Tax=Lipomyces kononenkoae TaxID=34357 RepID=A0ACC3SUE7_LIPKO
MSTAETSASTGIVLHWLEQSRSHRILWLLEELQLPYTLKTYKRDPKTYRAEKSLKEVHPLGKSPVITDDGKVIAESIVIIDYLIHKYGGTSPLVPKTTDLEDEVKYYLAFAESTLQPNLLVLFVSNKIRQSPVPFFIRPVVTRVSDYINGSFLPDVRTQLDYLESKLKTNGTDYFVGDGLTGADIILIFPLKLAKSRAALTKDQYPLLWKWIEQMEGRDAYVRASKKVAELMV